MTRKKPEDVAGGSSRQVNFRTDAELHARLESTAEALGLDVGPLVRMILLEHLSTYEERAEHARRKKKHGH